MTYSQLKYFLEVVQTGNFTRAADRLFVTTPSLSKCIGSLEDELGFKLFERRNRGVDLTKEGRLFYNAIERPYQQLEIAYNHSISRIHDTKNNIVIASGHNELLPHSLTNVIRGFNLKYKDSFRFLLRTDSINHLYAGLSEELFDLIIINEAHLKAMTDVSYYPLQESRICFALRYDHPMARKEQLSFSDFTDDCFIITVPEDDPKHIEPLTKLLSFAKDSLYVYSLQDALHNVACGNGIAIVPHNTIDIQNPCIRLVPLPLRLNEACYCVAWRTANQNPIVKELAQAIHKDYLSQQQALSTS